MIDELAKRKYQLTLSVSLHACDNETRGRIMPVNHSYPIEELLAACKRYFEATGRRISYEYSLIAGVNDSPEQAKRAACPAAGSELPRQFDSGQPGCRDGFQRGSRRDAEVFRDILTAGGLSATIRRELGTEIDAACGQLRRNEARKEGEPVCG